MARKFALIAPIRPFYTVFYGATKLTQMHQNGRKHIKTWVEGLMVWIGFVLCKKFCCDFMAWTFVLVAPVRPVLHRVLCSNETIPNAPKTLRKAPKHEFRVQWRGSGAFVAKKPRRLCGTNFCINMLHRVSCSDETVPNAPKHYEMHENLNFGSIGADKLRLLRKIPTWHIVLH